MARNTVATLELQMIADIARLQKDMRAMERIVGDATSSATGSFNNAGKAAAGYAQEVQDMARKASGVRSAMQGVTASAAQQKAGMQQLGFQMQDLGVQFSMAAGSGNVMKGVMTALAMQGPQVVSAIALMRGEAKGLIGFLQGPWGAAFMAAASVAAMLIPKLFETSDAMKDVKFASSAVGDAQGILGGVLDLTTGKVNNQSSALMGLAQAQLAVARVQAQTRQAEARAQIGGVGKLGFAESFGHLFDSSKQVAGRALTQDLMKSFLAKATDTKSVIRTLEEFNKAGMITTEVFTTAVTAVANLGVEGENLKAFEAAQRVLDGVGNAVDRNLLLKPKRAAKETKKAVEEIKIHPLDQAVIDSWVNVQKIAGDIAEKALEWGKGQKTLGEQMIQDAKDLEALEAARADGAQQILDLYLQQLDVMRQMGGAAGTMAGLLSGLAIGNFSGVGGKAGRLLQGVGLSVGKDGWKAVTDKLDAIFGSAGDGSFARIMQKTFAAGGMGSLAGSMVNGSSNSAFGSFAGGALGEKFGEKFMSKGLESIAKGLGDFAGPLGSIVGGILGGALGGLLKKAKWGTSVVTGQSAGDVSTAGNKAAYTANAGLAGSSIQGGLQAIADQFGADIGGYNVSIGQYKGKWRVSSSGRSGKLKGKYGDVTDFGKEGAEDAIKFAIADAIKDGALIGLRASTQALLRASDDVETQLQKALQFEGVFSELKSMTDPVGHALETLDKSFDQLRKVFEEAGATTQEYADLEQLYQLKRIEAIKDANSEADELSRNRRTLEARILELQGHELASVAMMRQIELEQMEASLRPLQQRVWAMEDASAIIAEMQPFVDSLKAYRDTLFGGTDAGLTYRSAMVKLMGTGGLAAAGDKVALGNLQAVSQDFLGVSKDSATSLIQYQHDLAMVARYVDGGIGAAQEQIDYARLTLDAQDASVALLTSIDASLSVGLGALTPGLIEPQGTGGQASALLDEVKGMRAESQAQNLRIAENTAAIQKLMTRWDGDGLLVRGEADSPVYVSDAA